MITRSAETLLANRFQRTAQPTMYIAGFRLPSGQEVALERNRIQAIYLWTAPIANAPADLVQYRRRYGAQKSRNSNLNSKHAPTLKLGKPVDYWVLPSVAALERLLSIV